MVGLVLLMAVVENMKICPVMVETPSLLSQSLLSRLYCHVFTVTSLLSRLYCHVFTVTSLLSRLYCHVFTVTSLLSCL